MSAQVTSTKALFSQMFQVSIDIDQPLENVWQVLSSSDYTTWNSTVIRMSGELQVGGRITLVSSAAPDQTFKLKVSRFEPHQSMVWESGQLPFFGGRRTYTLEQVGESQCRFIMQEQFRGLLMPLMHFVLPDFTENFKTFALDLKKAVET